MPVHMDISICGEEGQQYVATRGSPLHRCKDGVAYYCLCEPHLDVVESDVVAMAASPRRASK